MYACESPGRSAEALGLLELKSQRVVSCYVEAGKEI